MLIVSDGKNIDTLPFQNLFVQGEKLSEKVTFRIPRFYNEKDLLPCIFLIKGVNSKNETAEQILAVSNKISSLELEWNVSSLFTAAAGELKLEIQALTSDSEGLKYALKYILPPIYVRESVNGSENIPVPDLTEQSISQINAAVSEGINSINKIISDFDISWIENRFDSVESDIENLNSEIKIKALSESEYNAMQSHSENVVYLIV